MYQYQYFGSAVVAQLCMILTLGEAEEKVHGAPRNIYLQFSMNL